ncbi:MAG TPA: diacylglycerol kinase family protein [Pseudonocardiaceae bacterium]|nr:diacylglycerol kinase family protein [Pseudonocardiaceae bacterium]
MASRHIALILNPLSGSGMQQPTVRRAAWARQIDVREVRAGYRAEALARDAVDKGAQVLIAAGGDGTVSAVAGVAVEHDVPLVVVPCGTRNHFAKDCGTDITDPAGELAAVEDGVELRVDVGMVNGQVFLDNVSVGFYAAMVRDPDYRRRRVRVAARYARRALLGGGRRASLCMPVPRGVVAPEQLLVALVSNNAYFPGVAPGPALRPRLDEGMLWVYLMGLPGARRPLAARVVRGTGRLISGRALVAAWPTSKQIMTTDTPSIPVGVDGEPAELQTPLEFAVCPRALRLLQPSRNEPVDRRFSLRW